VHHINKVQNSATYFECGTSSRGNGYIAMTWLLEHYWWKWACHLKVRLAFKS